MIDQLHKQPSNVTSGDIFRMLWKEVREHRGLFSLMFFGAIGIQLASLATPLYMKQFFNVLVAGVSPAAVHTLLVLIIIIGAISAAGWVFRRMQMYGITHFESLAMTDLYVSAFDRLIGHSYQFFISHFSGTLTRRVAKYAGSFEALMDSIMMEFFPMAIFVVGAVGILFLRSHILGIVLGIWVIVFVAFQMYTAHLKQPLRIARTEADSKLVGVLSDDISNQSTIALFSGGTHEHRLFEEVVGHWHAATMRSWNTDELIWALQDVLIVGVNIGLLWGTLVLWQKGEFTVGDFVLVQSYLLGLFNQLTSINRNMRRCYDAVADASEMMSIIKTPHDVQDLPHAPNLAVKNGEIVFDDAGFSYPNGQPALQHFNLTVRGGEKLAFVGPSGAGKTTITKLLLRFYDVTAGAIRIDGQNISAVTQDSLRDKIAFVPQEPILFHRTLMENIRYGLRGASDEEVVAAAMQAHCHEFISTLSEGYATLVGERGVKLSGGERQRVAIARAILKNAPILVLDEATSSLDSESEALIQDALQTLMRGKTVIVIAHRLSTIMKMDRIVVIENGGIAAEGSHQELLTQGGLYKKLWSIQAGGFQNGEMEPEMRA
jgi:ATP-binding cassette, subfamily B, bacterial